MKKIIALILVLCVIQSNVIVSCAGFIAEGSDIPWAEYAVPGELYINNEKIDVEGAVYFFDGFYEVLVPLRLVFETLGATVEWNGDEETISIKYRNKPYLCSIEVFDDTDEFFTVTDEDIGDLIPLNPYSGTGLFINMNDRIYIRKDAFESFFEAAGCETEIDFDNKILNINEIDLLSMAEEYIGGELPDSASVDNYWVDRMLFDLLCKISFDKKDTEYIKDLLENNLNNKSDNRFYLRPGKENRACNYINKNVKWGNLVQPDNVVSSYYRVTSDDSKWSITTDVNGWETLEIDYDYVWALITEEGTDDKNFLYLYCSKDIQWYEMQDDGSGILQEFGSDEFALNDWAFEGLGLDDSVDQ